MSELVIQASSRMVICRLILRLGLYAFNQLNAPFRAGKQGRFQIREGAPCLLDGLSAGIPNGGCDIKADQISKLSLLGCFMRIRCRSAARMQDSFAAGNDLCPQGR